MAQPKHAKNVQTDCKKRANKKGKDQKQPLPFPPKIKN